MRFLVILFALASSTWAAVGLACDTGSYPTVFEMADAAELVAVGRATSTTELSVRRVLRGARVPTVTFAGSDCDPQLVPGHDYVVFVRGAPGAQQGVGFNESAIDLAGQRVPPSGSALISVERRPMLRAITRWLAAAPDARRPLLRAWSEGSGLLAAEATAQRRR